MLQLNLHLEMSYIHPEIQSDDYHRPSGLLSKSLQTFNKKKLFLISLSFTLNCIQTVNIYYESKPSIIWFTFFAFNHTFCLTICLYLIYKRNTYNEFVNYFDQEIGIYAKNDPIRKSIARNRLFTKIYGLAYFMISLTFGVYFLCPSGPQSIGQLAIRAIKVLYNSIIDLSQWLLIQFIIESCLHIQICFEIVLDRIRALEDAESSVRIEQLQNIRQLYDVSVEKTRKFDSIVLLMLAVFYFNSLVTSEAHLFDFLYNYDHMDIISMIWEISTFIFVTSNVANINRLANAAFNRVYSLSYKCDSLELIYEIRYFLIRIGRNDVGLTVLKVILITPAFFTSITTILLTIFLATPSLFQKKS